MLPHREVVSDLSIALELVLREANVGALRRSFFLGFLSQFMQDRSSLFGVSAFNCL